MGVLLSMPSSELVLSVSDFVGLLNQTLEFAYPSVVIVGELANFKVSKNRWVYFDLKDEAASVKFFGTIYMLPGPLEDGMLLQVHGMPRLHPLYGFSINVQAMQPVGEGSIKRAAALLQAKLQAEGLFDETRKRTLPYPPERIGLIASSESAAYRDFIKIIDERWGGVGIKLADVQVQGEPAIGQIVNAIEYFNQQAQPPEVLVITRGGGSAEDLGAFSTEQVTRAVAASRIPTLVAIGHEVDISLAELAADQRASTPSNAAQLLVPDREEVSRYLTNSRTQLGQLLSKRVVSLLHELSIKSNHLQGEIRQLLSFARQQLNSKLLVLRVLDPDAPIKRGYALVFKGTSPVKSIQDASINDSLRIKLGDGALQTIVEQINKR